MLGASGCYWLIPKDDDDLKLKTDEGQEQALEDRS